jgi:EsV-1-7 cysteine-rich motif
VIDYAHAQVSINPDRPMRQGKQKSTNYAPKCQDPACTGKVASFGYEEDGKRVMCATHKAEGMTNLVSPVCEHPACTTIASFGFTKVADQCAFISRTTVLALSQLPLFFYSADIVCCLHIN